MKKTKKLADFIIYKWHIQGDGIVDVKYELLKAGIPISEEQYKSLIKVLRDSELVAVQTGKYSNRINLLPGNESFPLTSSISEPGRSIVDIFKNGMEF